MARHLPFEINQKRKCPLDGVKGEVQLEVVVVEGVHYSYEIPRLCLESLGIDVGEIIHRTYWFRSEDSARMRAHRHAHEVIDD